MKNTEAEAATAIMEHIVEISTLMELYDF